MPGLREELVTALIRSLPKQLRVNFVPAPNVAKEFLAVASPGEEALLPALSAVPARPQRAGGAAQRRGTGRRCPTTCGRPSASSTRSGRWSAQGKDLDRLKEPLRPKFQQAMAEAASSSGLDVTGATSWTFGTIERTFTQTRAGHDVRGFPGLVDEGATVGLQVFGAETERDASHLRGLRRLLMLSVPLAGTRHRGRAHQHRQARRSPGRRTRRSRTSSRTASRPPSTTWWGGTVVRCGTSPPSPPWPPPYAATCPRRHASVMHDVVRVLAAWREVDKALTGSVDMVMLPALADMKAQVGASGAPRLHRLGRGRLAAALPALPRRGRASGGRGSAGAVARDRQLMDQVVGLQEAYLHRLDALPEGRLPSAELTRVGWLLEELRVSLWAQSLGTSVPVSDTRIRKALDQA